MSAQHSTNPHNPSSNLPETHTYVTTHDEKTGKSVYHSSTPMQWKAWNPSGIDIIYSVPYTTQQSPAVLTNEADIKAHSDLMSSGFGSIKTPHGSNLRMLDLPPNYTGIIHRTVSLDYGIVIEGQVEMVLDGEGEKRILKRGDVIVQRGTMHGLNNPSADEWARIVFVVLDAEKVVVAGEELDEKWGL
jgi:quercetin dioxygenase-like cupin family protein